MPLATAQRCREQDSVPLALLSVSDKTGLIPLAQSLVQEHGFQLLSSGGTAKALSEAGIPVTPVSAHTGAPEILGGRVKTLHPRIHGGILARLECSEDRADLEALGIPPIQLVVVNFYPFEQTVAQAGVSLEEAFEQIDIGGPTLARAAAKNYPYVTVLTDPSQYPQYLQLLSGAYGETERLAFRFQCARRAFEQVLAYDRAIVNYLARPGLCPDPPSGEKREKRKEERASLLTSPFSLLPSHSSPSSATLTQPGGFQLQGIPWRTLRYGENPHQAATWYVTDPAAPGWHRAKQLQGKELSYNNLLDLEAARALAAELTLLLRNADATRPTDGKGSVSSGSARREFLQPEQAVAVVVKHNNPCGVAIRPSPAAALEAALAADPVSAFGGIVALNQPLDAETARRLVEPFLECVVAPDCTPEAAELLSAKKNLRVLILPDLCVGPAQTIRTLAGGFLVQDADSPVALQRCRDQEPTQTDSPPSWQVVTQRQPTPEEWADLEFAWIVCKHVKSNAIVVAKQRQTLGVGAGQMNRVGAAEIALQQAGSQAAGAVLASDGFFPFADSVEMAARAGICAIIQPGGSIRDADSIAAANAAGIAMVCTGIRHFLH
ncbi:bifunctional phosphoribosylaminoimidazolecarboxamide formyltransferase/IMP cyclohydrolase [Synechococcus sp. R60.3]|uniref:bifunctional phosphoribosylaminoimidazolecarboxamide formyltransferase/IMP cyclohydrolase n=1 Tax=unclassified Synechococcus TaxID=2626047 RepID=UPI0039C13AA0